MALFQADDPAVFIGFADMFGDGLQHLVRESSGAVWVWPNLGYGRFGARRVLVNAPLFPSDLTADRILLADRSGNGPLVLLQVAGRPVELSTNRFGTGLGAPFQLALALCFYLAD